MYQRLSAHLNSVDLPQLDFKEISRETKSRVETALGSGSRTSGTSSGNAQDDVTSTSEVDGGNPFLP